MSFVIYRWLLHINCFGKTHFRTVSLLNVVLYTSAYSIGSNTAHTSGRLLNTLTRSDLRYNINPDCFISDQYNLITMRISLGWLTVEIGVFRTSWLKMVTIIYCRAKFFPCLRILKIYGCFSRLVQIFANKWAWLSQWLTRYSLLWPLHFLFTQNIIHVKFDWKG